MQLSRTEPLAGRSTRPALAAAPRTRRHAGLWRPYLYLLPALAFLGLFVYWPLVQVGYLSLHQWNLISPLRPFVGLANYQALLADPLLLRVLAQSAQYALLALLGNFLLPVGLALLTLQVVGRGAAFYQAALFLPTVVASSVGALLWQWVYLPTGGLLNGALTVAGLGDVNWLNNPGTALGAVGVATAWKFLGFNYLFALAGLRAIPRDPVEAAQVDGAGPWALLTGVVLPLLAPTLLFLGLTTVLQALPNTFVPIQILTKGGPSDASTNLLYAVYQDAFQFFAIGRASAEAVLLLLLLGGLAVWQFRLLERRLDYDR